MNFTFCSTVKDFRFPASLLPGSIFNWHYTTLYITAALAVVSERYTLLIEYITQIKVPGSIKKLTKPGQNTEKTQKLVS
jgi:hypothetical protein